MADEETPTIQADNVTVVESSAAVDAAEERAEHAEQLAADITDAAMRTAQGAAIEENREGLEECQQQTEQLESAVEADHARLTRLETSQAEMAERLAAISSTQVETLDLLRTLASPSTPAQSDPNPTQEADPAEVLPDAVAPEAPAPAARRRMFRWM